MTTDQIPTMWELFERYKEFLRVSQPVQFGATIPRDLALGDEADLKELVRRVKEDGLRVDLVQAMLMLNQVDKQSLIVLQKPNPIEMQIVPIRWDDTEFRPLRHCFNYGFFPEARTSWALSYHFGTAYYQPCGWRLRGTKQRPVRANKRRRLARRFPKPNCQKRSRRKLALKKLIQHYRGQ